MEISSENIENIQLAGESAHISDTLYKTFIENICESLLYTDKKYILRDNPKFSKVDSAVLKQAYAGVSVLLLEATKVDQDEAGIREILEDCKYSPERVKIFLDHFNEIKPQLQILLSSTGHNPPHIVDVDWRLDHYVKNNHLEKVSQPVYQISLKTEECGIPGSSSLDFACSQDQLQDLVAKLKDACKSMERVSQL